MSDLNDDQKKMLTEKLLKEKWHSFTIGFKTGGLSRCSCGQTGHIVLDSCAKSNRTFLTWQDLGDCKEALVKKGLWDSFTEYAEDTFSKEFECYKMGNPSLCDRCSQYVNWLFRTTDENGKAHFCRLCAEFMATLTP